jgi:ligand-binding SRPBCC domain-containing protein
MARPPLRPHDHAGTLISQYDHPYHFQDIMLRGMFKSFIHDHYFDSQPDGATLMRDELRFTEPLGPLGWLAETLVLRRYLRRYLAERDNLIKAVAASPEEVWRPYLANS